MMTREDEISNFVLGSAIEVHRYLGPGLLESAYEECLAHEFMIHGRRFERQKSIPIIYKGVNLDCGFRLDFLVEDLVIVELKAVEKFTAIHDAQLLSHLKLMNKKLGLLLNFNVVRMAMGIRRKVNGL